MKLSSPLIILTAIAATTMLLPTTVEGKKRKKKPKSEKSSSATTASTAGDESDASSPTTASPTSSKGSKGSKSSKSSKSISFQTCSIANPPYEQAKLITGDNGLSVEDFLSDDLLDNGEDGYLAWHSIAVYTNFVGLVDDWVKDPSDDTKTSITEAGQDAGAAHTGLNLSASDQCGMMDALVRQMEDSCFYNYGGKEVFVDVASAYMTGFNEGANDDESNEVKEDFVGYCDLGSMWG